MSEWAICSKILAKKSKFSIFSMFYIRFFHLKNEQIVHSLFLGERYEWIALVTHKKWAMWVNRSGCSLKMSDHEWFAQVAHQKWATMRESLRSLTKNERMSELLFFLANRSFAHFFAQNERFARKTDEWIPSPAILCPRSCWPSINQSQRIVKETMFFQNV